MIRRTEIGKLAFKYGVPERTIQKDYVITRVLRELAPVMPAVGLRFKGGTCLKKCYFADYRFSEDMEPARLHEAIERKSAQLRRAWETQLGEQLPMGALPGYEDTERQMLRLLKKHGFTA